MAASTKLTSIRFGQLCLLSGLLFLFGVHTFLQLPIKDVSNAPVFTTIRDPRVRKATFIPCCLPSTDPACWAIVGVIHPRPSTTTGTTLILRMT